MSKQISEYRYNNEPAEHVNDNHNFIKDFDFACPRWQIFCPILINIKKNRYRSKSLYSVRMREMGTRKNLVSGYFSRCLRHYCATLSILICITFYCLSFHFICLLYHFSSWFLLPKKLFFIIHNLLNSSSTSQKKIVVVAL